MNESGEKKLITLVITLVIGKAIWWESLDACDVVQEIPLFTESQTLIRGVFFF